MQRHYKREIKAYLYVEELLTFSPLSKQRIASTTMVANRRDSDIREYLSLLQTFLIVENTESSFRKLP